MRRRTGLLAMGVLLAATAAAVLAWGAAATAAPLAVLRIPAHVDVAGPDILLGDIAHIETDDADLARRLQGLSLGRAAMPGQSRELSVATVLVRIRQQALPEKQIVIEAEQPRVAVATRAAVVAGADLVRAAEAAVLERALPPGAGVDPLWRGAELILTCPDPGNVMVADGRVELRVPRVTGTAPGPVVAAVDVVVDDLARRTVMVRCDAKVALDVAVVTASVARHEGLSADNVTVERRDFSSLPRGLLPAAAVLGDGAAALRATRPLMPGTLITDAMVETTPVVLRGAQVQIVAETTRIHVAAPGVALEDGRIGEVIRVQNISSGQVVRARVVAADRVEAIVP